MKTTIWLQTPVLNRYEDIKTIEQALRITYQASITYFLGSWIDGGRIHYVELDGVTKTKAEMIANNVKAFHVAEILNDTYKSDWQHKELINSLNMEVSDYRPEWAAIIYK